MKLFINGSPKLDNSNSNYFLKKLSSEHYISYVYKDKFSEILKNMKEVDTIILSFPLYVDDVPNKVIELFEYIENNQVNIKGKKVYAIINCGFWEAKQNRTADLIVQNFANNNGAKYMGSFNIGAGEIIGKCNNKKIYRLVSIPFLFKIRKFKKSINKGKSITLETTIRPMSKRLYVVLANYNWKKKMIKSNCYNKSS